MNLIELKQFDVISATSEHAEFVSEIYKQNIEALHGGDIYNWREIFSYNDPDEKNFIVYKNNLPTAWLRVNGLGNNDIAWISMLVISVKFQRQGIGTYAVKFAEEYIKSKGFKKVGIRTTEDNFAAKVLYKKCGYVITEYGDCTNGDGMTRKGCTFEKDIEKELE